MIWTEQAISAALHGKFVKWSDIDGRFWMIDVNKQPPPKPVKQMPKSESARAKHGTPSMAEIRAACCAWFEIQEHDFRGRARQKNKFMARRIFYFIAYSFGRWSLAEIGRQAFGTCHSTVLSGLERVRKDRAGHQHDLDAVLTMLGVNLDGCPRRAE